VGIKYTDMDANVRNARKLINVKFNVHPEMS